MTPPEGALTIATDQAGGPLKRDRLNPLYNPDMAYIPRLERDEWDPVGLVGKLRVLKGQPTGDRWLKMKDISATVELWLVR